MNKNRGIIGTILLIVIALIILGFFGISFKSVYNSPVVQDNLKFAWELVVNSAKTIWNWLTNLI